MLSLYFSFLCKVNQIFCFRLNKVVANVSFVIYPSFSVNISFLFVCLLSVLLIVGSSLSRQVIPLVWPVTRWCRFVFPLSSLKLSMVIHFYIHSSSSRGVKLFPEHSHSLLPITNSLNHPCIHFLIQLHLYFPLIPHPILSTTYPLYSSSIFLPYSPTPSVIPPLTTFPLLAFHYSSHSRQSLPLRHAVTPINEEQVIPPAIDYSLRHSLHSSSSASSLSVMLQDNPPVSHFSKIIEPLVINYRTVQPVTPSVIGVNGHLAYRSPSHQEPPPPVMPAPVMPHYPTSYFRTLPLPCQLLPTIPSHFTTPKVTPQHNRSIHNPSIPSRTTPQTHRSLQTFSNHTTPQTDTQQPPTVNISHSTLQSNTLQPQQSQPVNSHP